MPVSDDDYNVTMTSIANKLFNDPAYKEYIQRRFIEFRRYKKTEAPIDPEWNSYSLDKLRWQRSHNNNEHLQPKAPEKIPEGWE